MSSETSEHKTPAGGVASTIRYKDREGNPTDKEKAVAAEVIETDEDGEVVARSYLALD